MQKSKEKIFEAFFVVGFEDQGISYLLILKQKRQRAKNFISTSSTTR